MKSPARIIMSKGGGGKDEEEKVGSKIYKFH
jgi:hypothetical protein